MPPKTTSAAASSSEILQDWADYIPPSTPGASLSAASTSGPGPYNYERARMEKAVRECCVEMVATAAAKEAARKAEEGGKRGKKAKREDVDFLVKELMMTREAAEAELQEADGDLTTAIKKIVVS